MKFVTIPCEIEAFQWDGDPDTLDVLRVFGAPVTLLPASDRSLIIGTLEDGPNSEAVHVASIGDWIVKGLEGEFYPVKPSIMAKKYKAKESQ